MVDQSAVEKFKASLRGQLLGPGEAGYDEARKVWNAMVDKRPALIARCAGAADVVQSVKFSANTTLQSRFVGVAIASPATLWPKMD